MKAYKLELLVLDFENYSAEQIQIIAENVRGLSPSVMSIAEADIGEWSDDHPLNRSDAAPAEFARLFPVKPAAAPVAPIGYLDPMSLVNFKAGASTKEWLWREPDTGLVPVFAAPVAQPAPSEALTRLKSDVMRAANQWVNAEYASAKSVGRGGPELDKRCESAELKVYKAVDALAAAAPASKQGEAL